MSPGWIVPSVSKDLVDPELSEGWNACFTVNLDVSKAVFIAFEIKPKISKLAQAMRVFKIKVSKALFSFQKGNL